MMLSRVDSIELWIRVIFENEARLVYETWYIFEA